MWRLLLQRLGIGYLLLLPALFALGGAMDAGIQAFCYHVHFPLEQITGRGLTEVRGLDRLIVWAWKNPGCVVVAFMLPWWIGAWALVRSKSAPNPIFFSQVVLGVLSATVAQIALFLWCAADLVRALRLWTYSGHGYACWAFLAVLLSVLTLVFVKASKLEDK